MSADKYPQLFSCQIGAIVYRALYAEKNSVEGSIVLFRGSYCCDALHSYFILRIYSATQGYNVVLCCIILKVAIKGCIVLFRGGGEGHIGVLIRGVCSTT